MHFIPKSLPEAGFTLIELLTVLVVVSITASLATPSIRTFIDQSRTRRALDQVVSDMAHARLLAVEEGRRTALRFQTDGTYTIEMQGTSGSWTTRQTVRLRDQFDGVSLLGDQSSFEFSSRGLVTNLSADAYVRIFVNDARDSVYVSPAGRAYRDY